MNLPLGLRDPLEFGAIYHIVLQSQHAKWTIDPSSLGPNIPPSLARIHLESILAVSTNWGPISWVSLYEGSHYFGVYIQVPDFWKLPCWHKHSALVHFEIVS